MQHVDDGRDGRALRRLVHVGDDREAKRLADLREHRQRRVEPDAALARERGAVRLVEGGLVDEAQPEPPRDLLQRRRHLQCMPAALHLARAGEHRDGRVVRDLNCANGNARIGLKGVVLAHGAL